MLKFPTFLFFVLIYLQCYSQHTEAFLNIASELNTSQSTQETKYFSGTKQLKEVTNYLIYDINGRKYKVKAGENILYYKNGQVLFDMKYDNFGNLLFCKKFDKNGKIIDELTALEIDIPEESIAEDILTSVKTIVSYNQKYYNTKNGKHYLFKEENKINNKRKGIWKTFDVNGNNIKSKTF